jgi:hypothetical protein
MGVRAQMVDYKITECYVRFCYPQIDVVLRCLRCGKSPRRLFSYEWWRTSDPAPVKPKHPALFCGLRCLRKHEW